MAKNLAPLALSLIFSFLFLAACKEAKIVNTISAYDSSLVEVKNESLEPEVQTPTRPNETDTLSEDKFDLAEPTNSESGEELTLWATNYYLPEFKDGSGDIAIRDMDGNELGPKLSTADWCNSALEGSVRIIDIEGKATTYNYHGVTDIHMVDCSSVFSLKVGSTKFRKAYGPYGDGIDDYMLAPYRTIATDPTTIATGTVLYIPEARGAIIPLKDGTTIVHDGYFFAADKGGAIKTNHIDVFTSAHQKPVFFPWIKSNSRKTFKAIVINNSKVKEYLMSLHHLHKEETANSTNALKNYFFKL